MTRVRHQRCPSNNEGGFRMGPLRLPGQPRHKPFFLLNTQEKMETGTRHMVNGKKRWRKMACISKLPDSLSCKGMQISWSPRLELLSPKTRHNAARHTPDDERDELISP